MKPLLEMVNLTKIYYRGSVALTALRDVSLQVRQGEFIAITGRSGSGKSTLLSLVGGLDTATSGRIRIRDAELTDMGSTELALYRRRTVGMVFQSFNLIPSRTAIDNVILALTFGDVVRKKRKPMAEDILSSLGLGNRLHHTPGELSGGEAQRVAIARALANSPDILLADEPTGNLDSATSDEIVGLLQQLNENGMTILMVTHDEEIAQTVSHRMVTLFDGHIAEEKIGGRNA